MSKIDDTRKGGASNVIGLAEYRASRLGASESAEDWDWAIGEVLYATNLPPQPDALALAALCGFCLWPTKMEGARAEGDVLYFDDRNMYSAQQHRIVARVVARWTLEWCELAVTDAAIDYVTRGLWSLRSAA